MSKNQQNKPAAPDNAVPVVYQVKEEPTFESLQAENKALSEENEKLKADLEKAMADLKFYADEAVKRNEENKKAKAAKEEGYSLSDDEYQKIADKNLKSHKEKIPKDKEGKFVHIQYLNHSSLKKNKTAPNPGDIVICRKQVADILEQQGKAKIITKTPEKEEK